MTDVAVPTGVNGRALSRRGTETRRRLLESAEGCFAEHGYHAASIVKITEAAGVGLGTFYLYFASKQAIFEELVLDLNARVRHYVQERAQKGVTRVEQELLGFRAFFEYTAEHPALYRVIRQAESASPEILKKHYERFSEGYAERLREAMKSGEIAPADPEMLTWALMGIAELIGMRAILWSENGRLDDRDLEELLPIVQRTLGSA